MRKLKMDLDALLVESFDTAREPAERGTVQGHFSLRCDTVNATCDGGNTCGYPTCNFAQNSCAESCDICDTNKCGNVSEWCILSDDGQCYSGACGT